jgi:hypothetical protein
MFNLYFFELWQFSNGSSWTVHGEEDMGMGRLIWGLIQSWTAPHVHCILVFLVYFLILFSKGRSKYMTSAWWHADITLLERSRAEHGHRWASVRRCTHARMWKWCKGLRNAPGRTVRHGACRPISADTRGTREPRQEHRPAHGHCCPSQHGLETDAPGDGERTYLGNP